MQNVANTILHANSLNIFGTTAWLQYQEITLTVNRNHIKIDLSAQPHAKKWSAKLLKKKIYINIKLTECTFQNENIFTCFASLPTAFAWNTYIRMYVCMFCTHFSFFKACCLLACVTAFKRRRFSAHHCRIFYALFHFMLCFPTASASFMFVCSAYFEFITLK